MQSLCWRVNRAIARVGKEDKILKKILSDDVCLMFVLLLRC